MTGCRSSSGSSDGVEATAPELTDSEVLALMLAQGYDIYNPRFSVVYNGRTIYGPARAIEEKIAQSIEEASETAEETSPVVSEEAVEPDAENPDDVPVVIAGEEIEAEDVPEEIVSYEIWDPAEDEIEAEDVSEEIVSHEIRDPAEDEVIRPEVPAEEPVFEPEPEYEAVSDDGFRADILAFGYPEENAPAEEDPVAESDGDGFPLQDEPVPAGEASEPVFLPSVSQFTFLAEKTPEVSVAPEATFNGVAEAETGDGIAGTVSADDTPGVESAPETDGPSVSAGQTSRQEEKSSCVDWNLVMGVLALVIVCLLIFGYTKKKKNGID